MSEVWRPTDVSGYEVSSLGRVRSHRQKVPKILKPGMAGKRRDYQFVMLGRGHMRYVHHLVCKAWHGPRPDGHHAAHRDGNAANNTPGNLKWATPVENAADKREHGTHARDNHGERNPNVKLTLGQAREIKVAALAGAETVTAIAVRFGMSRVMVSNIRDGKSWKELS